MKKGEAIHRGQRDIPPESRKVSFTVSIPQGLKDALQAEAARINIGVSALVTKFVEQGFARKELYGKSDNAE